MDSKRMGYSLGVQYGNVFGNYGTFRARQPRDGRKMVDGGQQGACRGRTLADSGGTMDDGRSVMGRTKVNPIWISIIGVRR